MGWRTESKLAGTEAERDLHQPDLHVMPKKKKREIKDHSEMPGLEDAWPGRRLALLLKMRTTAEGATGKVSWGSGCRQSGIWFWTCLLNIQVESEWSAQLDIRIRIQGIGHGGDIDTHISVCMYTYELSVCT